MTVADEKRSTRRIEVGVVTRDKTSKTRRVEIPRLVKHRRYGKYVRRRTVCQVHDENNESRTGDLVEIMETRPLSKTKHWRLVRVVIKGPGAAPVVGGIATTVETPPAERAGASGAAETPVTV